ncbi:hypothetical protein VE04_01112 [Pseudogymnoascus sp. 24MN13]|nr:hypothetical protein VE04_01112 [Pseudogymnoascus sp. 24MN13]
MKLQLVVPLKPGDGRNKGDKGVEELNGQLWHVSEPLDIKDARSVKFHCISYVWGQGRERPGSFFDNEISISDKTRPALIAAIRAIKAAGFEADGPIEEAFWIDALCVPYADGPDRYGTLERSVFTDIRCEKMDILIFRSMGHIYSAAESVIIIIQDPAWKIILEASSGTTPDALSYDDMQALEGDKWITSVWTYQELVNARSIHFAPIHPEGYDSIVKGERFFNCTGYSLDQWKKRNDKTTSESLIEFPTLNTFEDTLADLATSGYLGRSVFQVLANMACRTYDPFFPANRLLASLGALTQEVSWGPPTMSLSDLSEKVMATCEADNDYSFIYTTDERDETPGLQWRPDPKQIQTDLSKPVHLIPLLSWSSWGEPFGATQTGHKDDAGFWLDNMIKLQQSEAPGEEVRLLLENWLYRPKDLTQPGAASKGFFKHTESEKLSFGEAMLKALKQMRFSGTQAPVICEDGLFFPLKPLNDRQDMELFAASSIRWLFGSPGLVRWKEGDKTKYSTGVFTGVVRHDQAKARLIV